MNEDAPFVDERAAAPPRAAPPAASLRLTVVEHEGAPDRGTVHPPDTVGIELMTTWLSADLSAFVALDARR